MTQHFQGFAFVVPIGAAAPDAVSILLGGGELPGDLAQLLDQSEPSALEFEEEIAGLNPEATPEGLYLGGTENPNAEIAAAITQWALRRWGSPEACVFFSVSWGCTKARVGEFGGALNLVTRDQHHVIDTEGARLQEFLLADLATAAGEGTLSVTDIDWDLEVDGEPVAGGPPTALTVSAPAAIMAAGRDGLEAWVSERITELTGFCHRGFRFAELANASVSGVGL